MGIARGAPVEFLFNWLERTTRFSTARGRTFSSTISWRKKNKNKWKGTLVRFISVKILTFGLASMFDFEGWCKEKNLKRQRRIWARKLSWNRAWTFLVKSAMRNSLPLKTMRTLTTLKKKIWFILRSSKF